MSPAIAPSISGQSRFFCGIPKRPNGLLPAAAVSDGADVVGFVARVAERYEVRFERQVCFVKPFEEFLHVHLHGVASGGVVPFEYVACYVNASRSVFDVCCLKLGLSAAVAALSGFADGAGVVFHCVGQQCRSEEVDELIFCACEFCHGCFV